MLINWSNNDNELAFREAMDLVAELDTFGYRIVTDDWAMLNNANSDKLAEMMLYKLIGFFQGMAVAFDVLGEKDKALIMAKAWRALVWSDFG